MKQWAKRRLTGLLAGLLPVGLAGCSAASGSAAAEDRVPRAVRAGVRILLKKFFTPQVPAARNAYNARNTKKYAMEAG